MDKEQIAKITREIEEEYRKKGGDFFLFLFSYLFPRIDTKSDYITDSKNRYLSFCAFAPTEKKDARERLDMLAEHLDIKYYKQEFTAYLKVHSMSIPNSCTDEEYGTHVLFYGEDSDYFFIPVKTNLALRDKDLLSVLENQKVVQYVLVKKIMDLYGVIPKARRRFLFF